jgi:hypothetical protein
VRPDQQVAVAWGHLPAEGWGTNVIRGTEKPQESLTRATSTVTTPRTACRSGGAGNSATSAAQRSSVTGVNVPRPWSRTIVGGPENAQNISVMRPLSRRWAIVSAPLPW